MGDGKGKLMVFFEDPFWVGVFERYEDGKLSVAKIQKGTYRIWISGGKDIYEGTNRYFS